MSLSLRAHRAPAAYAVQLDRAVDTSAAPPGPEPAKFSASPEPSRRRCVLVCGRGWCVLPKTTSSTVSRDRAGGLTELACARWSARRSSSTSASSTRDGIHLR